MLLLSRFAAASAIVLLLGATRVSAEYSKFFEQDFEGAEWPEKLEHGHNSSPITTQIITLSDAETPALLAEGAAAHVGTRVVRFQPLQDDPHLSVINKAVLSRSKLGNNGAALFQVDFFLSDNEPAKAKVALLAQAGESDDPTEKSAYRFYRFGLDEKDRLFFSFTNGKAGSTLLKYQNIQELGIKRPGWHRFQMVFKGQDAIHCAIDGKQTNFSPMSDPTLTHLSGGIMVTRAPEGDSTVYADNLSIFWTNNSENDPVPSPWGDGGQPLTTTPFKWNTDKLLWLTSTSEAWKETQATKKLMFILFHNDDKDANEKILAALDSPEAHQVLDRCVLLRVDMAQASGLKVAEGYGVKQAPVVMVCDKSGKPKSQTSIDTSSTPTWEQIYAGLRTATKAPAAGN